jgi:DNA-directed RNA polymerase subunit RPC12/RpoP
MKQTAVEWLKDLYENQDAYDESILDEQWQKAIEMEKEQIMDAWIEGGEYGYLSQESDRVLAEQYYNETFNTTKTSTHSGLTSLDEHNSNAWSTQVNMYSDDPRRNGIACPKCGNELMDTNPMMTLTSHPAQKSVHCPKCEYKGYRIV